MNNSHTPVRPGLFTSIGGQAVIEGVMMRSPHFVAVAVRKPNQMIAIKNDPYRGWSDRFPQLKKPFLRGVVTLLESMIQGVEALSFSASIASDDSSGSSSTGSGEKISNLAIAGSIGTAVIMGLGLFVGLPHLLTALLIRGSTITASSPYFHLIDGAIKMTLLLTYVYLIAMMKDIHRVFQYHGAEHKSIYTFEAGEDLTVENARKYTTLHPRCGTSFLLFLVLISVAVFSIVFPLFRLTSFSPNPIANHLFMILVKIVLMLPVAGLSYEFIKMCACRMNHPFFKALIWPGMILQKLTTREPNDEQLEVALASLRLVLKAEKEQSKSSQIEISKLSELVLLPVSVSEFPEA